MVLEAVVFPSIDALSQSHLPLTDSNFLPFNSFFHQSHHHHSPDHWDCYLNDIPLSNPSSSDTTTVSLPPPPPPPVPALPKRRRPRTRKNQQEIENQRMTHIAVERNRRKQMNDYLSVLRSLMPDSYVQRGDQASIIGGAINFVKELEHKLQFLDSHKKTDHTSSWESSSSSASSKLPFSEFFTFPQYSTSSSSSNTDYSEGDTVVQSGIADVEVTMVETHANLKIRSKKRPKQLLKLVSALHSMRLTILHLNVTTTAQIILYSLSVKVEDDCKLGSVDDIAAALYQMMDTIHQEALLC